MQPHRSRRPDQIVVEGRQRPRIDTPVDHLQQGVVAGQVGNDVEDDICRRHGHQDRFAGIRIRGGYDEQILIVVLKHQPAICVYHQGAVVQLRRFEQLVAQPDLDALAGGRTQHHRLHRHAGSQFDRTGGQFGIEIARQGIAVVEASGIGDVLRHQFRGVHVEHGCRIVQGSRLGGQCRFARVVDQRAAVRIKRPAEIVHRVNVVRDNNKWIARIIDGLTQHVVGQHGCQVVVPQRCICRAGPVEILRVGDPQRHAESIVERLQITLGLVIRAHDAPHAAPPAVLAGIHAVGVVGRVSRLADHRGDRHGEGELLGDAVVLGVAPARGWRRSVAGAALQPSDPVDGGVVLVLMAAGLDFDPHQITRKTADHGRERVTGFDRCRAVERGAAPEVERRRALVHLGDGPRHRSAVSIEDLRRKGKCQVAGQPVGLGAVVAVRSHVLGIKDPQPDGLVSVVDHQHADIVGRDGLRTGPWNAARAVLAENVRCPAKRPHWHQLRFACCRYDGLMASLNTVRSDGAVRHDAGHTGLVGVLEVAELEVKLAVGLA